MPIFSYTARSRSGDLVSGSLDATNAAVAARSLRGSGLTPISIQSSLPSSLAPPPSPPSQPKGSYDPLDAMLFSQQLSTMLRAGVPILRALSSLQDSASNPLFSAVLRDVREQLDSGKPLSHCLARHPRHFNGYYISMIQVGEMTGKLDAVLEKLFEHLDFQRAMREQISSATRYPLIVLVVMLGALLAINFFVIPAFAKVYQGFKAELPLFTKILIGTSQFLLDYWWVLALLSLAAIALFRSWRLTDTGDLSWNRFLLRLPVAGKIIHKAIMARFCRSLALSMEAGVPIASAIGLVSDSTGNSWISRQLSGLKTQIERGDSVYKSCQNSGAFTSISLQMILVGEESGNLDRMLFDVSRLYQSQVEYELKTLGSQIEPILLIFLGGLVLVLALGVFLPIWGLSSAAFHKG